MAALARGQSKCVQPLLLTTVLQQLVKYKLYTSDVRFFSHYCTPFWSLIPSRKLQVIFQTKKS